MPEGNGTQGGRGRTARVSRETGETKVEVRLDLDGRAKGRPDDAAPIRVKTGIGFFDHMLYALAFHAGWGLELRLRGRPRGRRPPHRRGHRAGAGPVRWPTRWGDDRKGIARFGHCYAPLDEALARAVVDVSGRPFYAGELNLQRERVGALSCEMVPHFFHSFAQAAALTLHVDVIRGANDHHRIEACFKAVALALRAALAPTGGDRVPSTKGML